MGHGNKIPHILNPHTGLKFCNCNRVTCREEPPECNECGTWWTSRPVKMLRREIWAPAAIEIPVQHPVSLWLSFTKRHGRTASCTGRNFPAFYEKQRFVTVYSATRHWILSEPNQEYIHILISDHAERKLGANNKMWGNSFLRRCILIRRSFESAPFVVK